MHVIRLRDPCDASPQADGTIRFTRHFNRPTGLASGDRGVARPVGPML